MKDIVDQYIDWAVEEEYIEFDEQHAQMAAQLLVRAAPTRRARRSGRRRATGRTAAALARACHYSAAALNCFSIRPMMGRFHPLQAMTAKDALRRAVNNDGRSVRARLFPSSSDGAASASLLTDDWSQSSPLLLCPSAWWPGSIFARLLLRSTTRTCRHRC